VDKEIEADQARLEREVELHIAASAKRQEWSNKEARHHGNIQSLVQLIINRATEVQEPLPAKVAQQATRMSIHIPPELHPIKTTEINVNGTTIEPKPKLEELPDADLPTDNKTEFVRQMVVRKGSGIRPSAIRAEAKARKMDLAVNFPYTILYKLKAAKQIREENGWYFPVVEEKEEGGW
jgi:hypothetical protein